MAVPGELAKCYKHLVNPRRMRDACAGVAALGKSLAARVADAEAAVAAARAAAEADQGVRSARARVELVKREAALASALKLRDRNEHVLGWLQTAQREQARDPTALLKVTHVEAHRPKPAGQAHAELVAGLSPAVVRKHDDIDEYVDGLLPVVERAVARMHGLDVENDAHAVQDILRARLEYVYDTHEAAADDSKSSGASSVVQGGDVWFTPKGEQPVTAAAPAGAAPARINTESAGMAAPKGKTVRKPNPYAQFTKANFPRVYAEVQEEMENKKEAFQAATKRVAEMWKAEKRLPKQ